MGATGLRRPRRFFERPWPWLAIAALTSTGVMLGTVAAARYVQRHVSRSARPMFWLISALGVVTVVLILAVFFYSVRKRLLQERLGGTMMSWLNAHVWLGLASVVAALAHAALFPLQRGLSSGRVAGVMLVLLLVSGVTWRIVYAKVPPRVAGDVGNLSVRATRERMAELRGEFDKLTAARSETFARAAGDLVERRRTPDEIQRDVDGLDDGERAAWDRARDLAARIERHSVREGKQQRYTRALRRWKLAHLPLAAILVGAVGVHLWDVFNVGRRNAPEPERRFTASAECAQCHGDIAQEWKLSMHRDAQTSTVTFAQTDLALDRQPGFGKACVNCHAPIGTKFSKNRTLPLADPDLAGPSGVHNEGVTCVVCHTMPHPPVEGAGAGDLPVPSRRSTFNGTMFGPRLDNPGAIPVSTHDSATGFMGDSAGASQLCGSCHNVKIDIDGDGVVKAEFAKGGPGSDADGDGVLDENELDIEGGKLEDLVLQTTFDEWEDYMASKGGRGLACVDCHMPRAIGPLVDNPPPALPAASRPRSGHFFVGVDYDLDIGYYGRRGMPEGGLSRVLQEREKLLARSAGVRVDVDKPGRDGTVKATVTVSAGEGHSFPTGFAFARQFWLEVSARNASGAPVCLAPDPHGIPSPCGSGTIRSPSEDLATCDPQALGLGNKEIELAVVAPRDACDPWLANFQKILSDGDADKDGIFVEVPYQSLAADIVKLRVRTADQKVMAPIPQGGSATFDYVFDAANAGAGPIAVRAVLRHRHLPPHFVRALDGRYPGGLTASKLLENMTVVDVASNEPLPAERTSPSPVALDKKVRALAAAHARPAEQGGAEQRRVVGAPGSAGLIVPLGLLLGLVVHSPAARCRRRRSTKP